MRIQILAIARSDTPWLATGRLHLKYRAGPFVHCAITLARILHLGEILPKIPLSIRKDMPSYGLRVIDTHDSKVDLAIQDREFKSRGFLNALKRSWSLRADEGVLNEALSLFDNWPGDRADLLLNVGNYLWSVVPGMTKELWNKVERTAVSHGIFTIRRVYGYQRTHKRGSHARGHAEGHATGATTSCVKYAEQWFGHFPYLQSDRPF